MRGRGRAAFSLSALRAAVLSLVGSTYARLQISETSQGGSMKLIATAALALALSAFGARAQTSTGTGTRDTSTTSTPNSQTTEDKGTATLPADQNSSALPGNSSNTSTSNNSLPSNNPASNATPSGDTSSKAHQR